MILIGSTKFGVETRANERASTFISVYKGILCRDTHIHALCMGFKFESNTHYTGHIGKEHLTSELASNVNSCKSIYL